MKKITFLLISLLCLQCQIDDFQSDQIENIDLDVTTKIVNGRLKFENKDSFTRAYQTMKDANEGKKMKYFENKYNSQFQSLVPVIGKNANQQLEDYRRLIDTKIKVDGTSKSVSNDDITEHFDDLEDVFGEDTYANFLNHEAELQVGDTIYSYTDYGLFYVHQNDYSKLIDYKNDKIIYSLSIDNMDNITYKTPCDIRIKTSNSGGHKEVAPNVRHYYPNVIPAYCDGDTSGGGNTGGGNTTDNNETSDNVTTTFDTLSSIAQNLPECNIIEPWVGNLFGTVKVCIDQYQSDRRVKTKYYDVDLGLAFAIGVKVKHQKKGWTGVWRKQDTEEVALGLNSLTWRFTHSVPPASSLFYSEPSRIFANNKIFLKNSNSPLYTQYNGGNVPVPQLPFTNDIDFIVQEIVTADSPFNFLDSEYEVREAFYELVWAGVKSQLQSEGIEGGTGAVIFNTPTQTLFQVYDFTNSCSNCSKEEKILDWGIATPQITINFGDGVNNNVSYGNWDYDFRNPDAVGLSCFGMAKRYGEWHGNILVFND